MTQIFCTNLKGLNTITIGGNTIYLSDEDVQRLFNEMFYSDAVTLPKELEVLEYG